MRIETIDQQSVAFGLIWRTPLPAGEPIAPVVRLQGKNAVLEAEITNGGERVASALALLAQAMPNGAVVAAKQLGDGLVWIGALYNGMPAVTGDRIVETALASTAIRHMIAMLRPGTVLLDGIGPDELDGVNGERHWRLADIMTKARLKAATARGANQLSGAALSPKLVVILLVGSVAAWSIWNDHIEKVEREKAAQALLAQQKQLVQPEETTRKAINDLLAKNVPVNWLLAQYEGKVAGMPSHSKGWALDAVECSVAKSRCEFAYQRDQFADDVLTVEGAVEDLTQRTPGRRVLVRHIVPPPFSLKDKDPLKHAADRFGDGSANFTVSLEHLLNDGLQISSGTPQTIPGAADVPGVAVKTATWTATGDLAVFDSLSSANLPAGTLASSITFSALKDKGAAKMAVTGVLLTIKDTRGAPAK